jgi:hypothetical protein
MRAHGVSSSVNGSGSISSSGGGSGASQQTVQSAMNACRHLLPNGGPNQAQVAAHQAQALKQDLKYTQCMRSHGVPNFPDPSVPPGGGPIGFRVKANVNAGSAAYAKANQACQSLLPGGGLPGGGS